VCQVYRLLADELVVMSAEVVAFMSAHDGHERVDIDIDLTTSVAMSRSMSRRSELDERGIPQQ
jgi:hypothetical protein